MIGDSSLTRDFYDGSLVRCILFVPGGRAPVSTWPYHFGSRETEEVRWLAYPGMFGAKRSGGARDGYLIGLRFGCG